jgi:hypothetical protein
MKNIIVGLLISLNGIVLSIIDHQQLPDDLVCNLLKGRDWLETE